MEESVQEKPAPKESAQEKSGQEKSSPAQPVTVPFAPDTPVEEMIDSLHSLIDAMEQHGQKMPESPNKAVRRLAERIGIYPIPNIAVETCVSSYTTLLQEKVEAKVPKDQLARLGRIAYCGALPHLTNAESIRDFISCVVHGMAIGVIPSAEGTRLLYGAQVAHSAQPSPKSRKKGRKSAQNAPSTHPVSHTDSKA